jgi:hypothetical protein
MGIVQKVILLVSLSVAVVMGGVQYASICRTAKVAHSQLEDLLHLGLDFASQVVLERSQSVIRTSEIISHDPVISGSLFLQVSTGINQKLNEILSIYPYLQLYHDCQAEWPHFCDQHQKDWGPWTFLNCQSGILSDAWSFSRERQKSW